MYFNNMTWEVIKVLYALSCFALLFFFFFCFFVFFLFFCFLFPDVDCVDEPCENQGQCLKNGTKTKCSCPNGEFCIVCV